MLESGEAIKENIDRVIKRRDLEAHLRRLGCAFHRHGGSHDIWVNLVNGNDSAVPRHREIPLGTVRSICKDLGVPVLRR